MYKPENPIDFYADFHGLYTASINERTATKDLCFVRTMMENSITAQENIKKLKNSRPCTRETRPMTALTTLKRPQYEKYEQKAHGNSEILDKNYENLFLQKDVKHNIYTVFFYINITFIKHNISTIYTFFIRYYIYIY